MALVIVSRRLFCGSETRFSYRVKGYGSDYDEFYDWLLERKPTMEHMWTKWPWNGWQFIDATNDVAIRLQWIEHIHNQTHDYYTANLANFTEPTKEFLAKALCKPDKD